MSDGSAQLSIPPDLRRWAADEARKRGFETVEGYLCDLLTREKQWAEVDYEQAVAGVSEGLEQVARGETVSLEEFDRRIRRKHGSFSERLP